MIKQYKVLMLFAPFLFTSTTFSMLQHVQKEKARKRSEWVQRQAELNQKEQLP